ITKTCLQLLLISWGLGWTLTALADDAPSVASDRGKIVYEQRCAVCHGPQGRGDGPEAPFLSPRPGSLISAATSVKSDADLLAVAGWAGSSASVGSPHAAQTDKQPKSKAIKASPAVSAVQMYVEAVASGDRVAAGLLDLACQFKMVTASPSRLKTFPPASDPVYSQCWDQLVSAHQRAVEQREQGV